MSFRITLFDQTMNPIGELSKEAGTLDSCSISMEINGDHSMSIRTTRHLPVGTRAITIDEDGRWWEWVVDESSEEHSDGDHATGEYHLVWSLQYDLQSISDYYIIQVGMAEYPDGVGAQKALNMAIKCAWPRWMPGVAEPRCKSSVVMTCTNAWERLQQVVRYWGGEVDVDIWHENGRITNRVVNLRNHIGDTEAWRRLEWKNDVTHITRRPDPGPYFCRVIPIGNGESVTADDGATSISWPLYIRSIYETFYMQDDLAASLFHMANQDGDYIYPTKVVSYSTDDVFELLVLCNEDLHNHTRPGVSYTATISQLAESGMDIGSGVSLGDEVQVHDYGFNEDVPLMVQERVIKVTWDPLTMSGKQVEIGKYRLTLEKAMAGIAKAAGLDDVESELKELGIEDINLPTVELPERETYTIDTDLGPLDISTYTIDTPEVDPLSFDEELDAIEDIILAQYGVEYDPETDTFYDAYGDEIQLDDYGNLIAGDEDSFVGNTPITAGSSSYVYPNAYGGTSALPSSGSSVAYGHDGWTHMINGSVVSSGTVNFITTSSGGSSGGGGSGGGGSTSDDRYLSNVYKNTSNNAMSQLQKLTKDKASKKKSDTSSAQTAKQQKVQITAANIAGSKTVDLNDTWGSSMIGPEGVQQAATPLSDWIEDVFGKH